MATAIKSFEEVFNEIKANVTLSKKGKPVKSFSRADFDKLAKAFLNEVNYSVDTVSMKGDELVKKQVMPVQMFRTMIKKILTDFGVDKAEAGRILETYSITNVDGMYEVCSELLYQYVNAGKKFDFMTKEDFAGSISLTEMGESVGQFTNIRTQEQISVRKKAHKVLEKKSKCPAWKKSKVK